MATNRYTNLSTSSFNPLSTEEIMMVPMYKQQQHLQQQAAVDAMGINLNRLDVDDPYYQEKVNTIKSQQDRYTDELMNKGTSRGLTRNLMNLSRERRDFLENDGKKIEAQYNAVQENFKAIDANKSLSPAQKEAGKRWAMAQYTNSGGVAKGASYSGYTGANFINIQDKAIEIASKMKPQEIEKSTGWRQTSDGTRWTNGTTTVEKLPAEVIQQAVNQVLLNDPEVVDYLKDAQKIGIIQDPTRHLLQAGFNAGNLLQVNNISNKQDMKFSPESMLKERESLQGAMNYIPSPTRFIDEEKSDYSTTVNNILNGTPIPTKSTHSPIGIYSGKTQNSRPTTVNDLPKEVRDRYSEIAQGLKRKGIVSNDNIEDKETLRQVAEYDKAYGKRDNSIAVINDVSGGVGKYSTGMISKDATAVLKAVQNTAHRAKYKHPKTGKVYTYEQMQDEFGVTGVDAVEGFVDVDNDLWKTVSGKNSDSKSEWVSPQVVSLKDKNGNVLNGWYKTRDDGEQMSPRYQADVRLSKNLFSKTKSNPLLPQNVTIGGREMEATYIPEEQALNILSTMQSRLFDNQGNIKPEADSEEVVRFQNLMEAKQKAGNRAGIYEFTNKDGKVQYNDKESIQKIEYLLSGVTNY